MNLIYFKALKQLVSFSQGVVSYLHVNCKHTKLLIAITNCKYLKFKENR